MKVFVWENVDNLTENYHDSGGLVVVAESLERARQVVNESGDKYERSKEARNAAYKELCNSFRAMHGLPDKGEIPTNLMPAWRRQYDVLNRLYPDIPHVTSGCVDGEEPTATYEVTGEAREALFVFPDAGCC